MPQDPQPPSSTHTHRRSRKTLIGLGSLGLVLISSLGFNAYAYHRLQDMNQNSAEMQYRLSHAQSLNKKLETEIQKTIADDAKLENKQLQAKPVAQDKAALDTHDGNFVSLLPNSGYLATIVDNTTFEWTPHKQANKYLVEIRFIGQQSYPDTTPADQIVTISPGAAPTDRIKLTKRMSNGDYQWRVTAVSTANGKDTVLQSTQDSYYQVHRYGLNQ